MNDAEITTVIKGLARPHPSGGVVIERAAILATGRDSPEIINWIVQHAGTSETTAARSRGLHGSNSNSGQTPTATKPTRFVLPAGALG